MPRLAAAFAILALAAAPALAQTPPATPPAAAPAQPQAARDVPMARLLTDGAIVRGVDSKDRMVLQLGRYVFLCRANGDGKPHLCDGLL